MRAYSDDLRQRILRAVDQGHRQAEIAAPFQVSLATIGRYLKQRRETGRASGQADSWPSTQETRGPGGSTSGSAGRP